jgi:hypothetical protein
LIGAILGGVYRGGAHRRPEQTARPSYPDLMDTVLQRLMFPSAPVRWLWRARRPRDSEPQRLVVARTTDRTLGKQSDVLINVNSFLVAVVIFPPDSETMAPGGGSHLDVCNPGVAEAECVRSTELADGVGEPVLNARSAPCVFVVGDRAVEVSAVVGVIWQSAAMRKAWFR